MIELTDTNVVRDRRGVRARPDPRRQPRDGHGDDADRGRRRGRRRGRDGRRQAGVARAPGAGARRDPRRRPRRRRRSTPRSAIGQGWTGETALIRLKGEVVKHPESVVLPLLLPDSPVVVWWPADHPDDPAADPLGRLGQRRITDSAFVSRGKLKALRGQCEAYAPGNTDLAWTRITPWRALLAAALDQQPLKVRRVRRLRRADQPERRPAARVAAPTGCGCPPSARTRRVPGITEVVMETADGDIRITPGRRQARDVLLARPARPAGGPEAARPARAARPRSCAGATRTTSTPRPPSGCSRWTRADARADIEVHDDAGPRSRPPSPASCCGGSRRPRRAARCRRSGSPAARSPCGSTTSSAGSGPTPDVDWSRVVFWWGDERYVAADSADRNARSARAAFLDRGRRRPRPRARGTRHRLGPLAGRGRGGVRPGAAGARRGCVRGADARHRSRRPRRLAVPRPPRARRSTTGSPSPSPTPPSRRPSGSA